MNLAQLRALRAVHMTGSVTRAARLLKVSQSAVSHALNSLESELEVRLMVRDRAGCSLTEVGRDLLPHAIEALHHVDQLEAKASSLASKPSGRLRIGLLPSTSDMLAPMIESFSRSWPTVEVVRFEGTADDVGEWMGRGVIEIGVTERQLEADAVPLTEDQIVVVIAAADEKASRAGLSFADIAAEPFLLYLGYERLARRLHAEQGVALAPAHLVWRISTLLEMVRAGLGVSVVSALALGGAPEGIAVVPLSPAETQRLWLAAVPGCPLSPAGRAFLDHVGAAVSGLSARGQD